MNNPLEEMVLERRRLLQMGVLGGIGLATAALIGCGDDDDDDDDDDGGTSTPTGTSTTEPTATETQAAGGPISGGTFRVASTGTPATLDPLRTQDANAKGVAASVYGTLLTLIGEPFENAPNPNFAPFLAESWEQTPDGLQMTFNIQPNANFTAPVSHAVEAEDVMFSFDRFLGNNGLEPAPNAAQFNFVDSYDGPDPKTVVVNMNAPSARSVARFADNFNVTIMPRETGDAFDPAETLVGSGPFLFDSWQPDVNVVRTRNPEWWGGPDKPYIDRVELSVLDSAQQVTQFKAGNLDRLQTLSPDAVPGMIQDRSDASVDPRKLLGWGYISRGEPRDGTAPWDDPRVRKAMSLALDRDALIEAVYNKSELEGLGLSVPAKWHNILPAGYPGQSVDPQTDPVTGQFINFDLTEANKLMQAADRGDGFSVAYHYTNVYGAAWTLEGEIIPQMMREIGIDFQTEIDDFSAVYTTQTFVGEFNGVAWQLQAFPDLGDYLTEMYTPGAGRNHSKVDDPAILAKVQDINTTLNSDERNEKIRNIHADLIEDFWYVPGVNWQIGWQAHDPRVAMLLNLQGNGRYSDTTYAWPHFWIDDGASG